MEPIANNLLIAQSGGPTAAINATLAGVVERALTCGEIGKIYGGRYGIKGIMEGDLIEIGETLSNPTSLKRLIRTPSALLGSCRLKLGSPAEQPGEYETVFQVLRRYQIGYFIYIGGNDSMDTVGKLSLYGRENGYGDIRIMGAPKTIDNDLCEMDHSPGYGSAAKYIATTFSELWCDCRVYDIPAVTIVEVMGRNVGWLTAASALARLGGEAPHFIYLPEVPFCKRQFVEDVRYRLETSPAVLIAVSEGIRDEKGAYVGETQQSGAADVFGHKYLSGAGKVLEDIVRREIGCKVRSIDLSLMQRCAGHLASASDLTEAKHLGATALDRAVKGESGRVSVLRRLCDTPYRVQYGTVPVELVANREKRVPREWINERGNFVTPELLRYLVPLVEGNAGSEIRNGLPVHLDMQAFAD